MVYYTVPSIVKKTQSHRVFTTDGATNQLLMQNKKNHKTKTQYAHTTT